MTRTSTRRTSRTTAGAGVSVIRNLTVLHTPNVWPKGLKTHGPEACSGQSRNCIFHNPSNHHMLAWDINVRLDRFGALAERICPHGIGHPDPDSLAYVESLHTRENRGYEGIHGCDGCCHPQEG